MLSYLTKPLSKQHGGHITNSFKSSFFHPSFQTKTTNLNNTILYRNFFKFSKPQPFKRSFCSSSNSTESAYSDTNTGRNNGGDASEKIRYKPQEHIYFKNGLADIYLFKEMKLCRVASGIMFGFFAYLGYRSVKKLYRFSERSFFGLIWYGGILILSYRIGKRIANLSSMIIGRIALCKDGKNIKIETYTLFVKKNFNKVDIAKIIRPVNAIESNMGGFGFSIVMDNRRYLLPRNGERISNELLPVILNGNYIDTSYQDLEI